MRFLLPYGAVVSLALCFSSTASADSYTLTKIADTSDGFFFGTSTPSINNQGTVAFTALLSGNPALGFGVFTGQGGSVDLIADASGPLSGFVSGALSINDAGIVSFIAGLDPPGGVGIFAGSGGTLIPIVETGGRFSNVGFVQPINDAGTVAFRAFEPGVGSGVFIGQGESITTIAQVTSSVGSVTEDVSINNGGTVAFTGAGLPGFGLIEGLFTGTGGPLTLIADTTGPFRGQFQPSINNNGDIAFRAALDTGGFGLFMYSGGSFTTVADTEGAFDFFFAQPPSINDFGRVAFGAGLDGGGLGIFIGPDPVADKVIASGDSFLGSTVTRVSISREGLNNAGQFALYAELADGTAGVYRATPVPEPSSLWLFSLGLLGLWARRR